MGSLAGAVGSRGVSLPGTVQGPFGAKRIGQFELRCGLYARFFLLFLLRFTCAVSIRVSRY